VSGARVLVVDDEPPIGRVIARLLSGTHDVTTMTSARTALEAIRKGERFDAILCDLMMPEMSGMDLHGQLVEVASDQASRMIFMTGGAFTARSRAFLDKMPRRIEKPFERAQLLAMIAQCSRSHSDA
jgi:CheY-like chemotaxis protein